ncbi:MAG: hypothetical protein NZ853_07310 [Leptospiraceae bacterium]|nr:hypothetical protein [Leptospiraceae bacterium]MDW7975758.1 hypothetical protein [Leptospiraceae bacterium]
MKDKNKEFFFLYLNKIRLGLEGIFILFSSLFVFIIFLIENFANSLPWIHLLIFYLLFLSFEFLFHEGGWKLYFLKKLSPLYEIFNEQDENPVSKSQNLGRSFNFFLNINYPLFVFYLLKLLFLFLLLIIFLNVVWKKVFVYYYPLLHALFLTFSGFYFVFQKYYINRLHSQFLSKNQFLHIEPEKIKYPKFRYKLFFYVFIYIQIFFGIIISISYIYITNISVSSYKREIQREIHLISLLMQNEVENIEKHRKYTNYLYNSMISNTQPPQGITETFNFFLPETTVWINEEPHLVYHHISTLPQIYSYWILTPISNILAPINRTYSIIIIIGFFCGYVH